MRTHRNKGGRPKGRKGTSLAAGVRKRRAEPTARGKIQLAQRLQELRRQPEHSNATARQELMRQYGLSKSAARTLEKGAERAVQFAAKRQLGVHGLHRSGSHLRKSKLVSKSLGQRIPKAGKTLGRTDHLRPVWIQTAIWGQAEEQCGHMLSKSDLLRDYEHRLQIAISEAEKNEWPTDSQKRQLAAWQKKQISLRESKKQRQREADKLAARAGLRERVCQQTINISPEEQLAKMEKAWQAYDRLLYKASQPKLQEDLFVREREDFLMHRSQTDLVFSDQIPVWLKPAPGRLLTSTVRLERSRLQSQRRKKLREAGAAGGNAEGAEGGSGSAEQQIVAAEADGVVR